MRFIAIAALLVALGGCGSIGFHGANTGPICTNFCVDLPGDYAAIAKIGSDDNCSFLDVIDQSPHKRWYSVEWCRRKTMELRSAEEFFAFWGDDAQQQYLATDFGKAQYKLVYSERIDMSDSRPAIVFVGAGRHNGGKPGSVIVVAAERKGIAMKAYLLLDRVVNSNVPISDSDDFKAAIAFANSVRARE